MMKGMGINMKPKNKCEECGAEAEYDTCEECCEHGDCDSHCCLICGKDMAESFACRAESLRDSMEDR